MLSDFIQRKLRYFLGIIAIDNRLQAIDNCLQAIDNRLQAVEIKQGYEHVTQLGSESENPIIKRSSNVPGWLFEEEHEFVYQQALSAPPGQFIEIGVLFGKSLSILAGAVEQRNYGEKIFAIDPFTLEGNTRDQLVHKTTHPGYKYSFDLFIQKSIELDYHKYIIPIATFSHLCLPFIEIKISFAFIDASHEKEAVKTDFSLIKSKLVEGAIILFHDALSETYPGVMEAIKEILQENPEYYQIAQAGSIVAIQYKGYNSPR